MEKSSPTRNRKRLNSGSGSSALEQRIAGLLALDTAALRKHWAALFGAEAPPRLSRTFMIRGLAYRLQERALGGPKPSTQRILDRVADGKAGPAVQRASNRRASAGTVLIWEWRGVSHRVTVLDHDVVYRGRSYKSLSEVARVITGTPVDLPLLWSAQEQALGIC